MPYDIGDAVTITTTVRDQLGVATDTTPTPVLTVTRSDGTTATPIVTHVGAAGSGQYQGTTTATLSGTWTYNWVSTGTVVAAEPGQFSVAFPQTTVASLEELKTFLNRSGADRDADDNELRIFLSSATRIVEYLCGPVSVQTYTERFVSANGMIITRRHPLVSVTSITDDFGNTVNLADTSQVVIDLDLNSVYLRRQAFLTGLIVYKAGRAAITDTAKLGGMIIAQHMWQTQNGGGGLAFPGDTTQVVISGIGYSIPNRAKELLAVDDSIEQVPGIA